MTRPTIKILLALLTFALTTAASAQQRTIYGPDGRVIGRVVTDSQKSQTLYGSNGRVTGRTSTDSQGTTTIRDALGRAYGTTTNPRR